MRRLPSHETVALCLLVFSCVLMVAGIILECVTDLRSTHLLDELFGASITLYGGHMVTRRSVSDPNVTPPTPPSRDITP